VFPPIMGAFCAHCAGVGVCGCVDISGVCEFWNWRIMDSHRETLVNVERPARIELELEKGEVQRVEVR
jgi:hypothetical protein